MRLVPPIVPLRCSTRSNYCFYVSRLSAQPGRQPQPHLLQPAVVARVIIAGQHDEAAALAGEQLALARKAGSPVTLGIALRVHGDLAEAIGVLEASPARYEALPPAARATGWPVARLMAWMEGGSALAIVGGRGLQRILPLRWIARLAALVMVVMAGFTLAQAISLWWRC